MKNYFKKFSIMFVMLLAAIGVGIIQNGNVANAATLDQQLLQPEDGWYRIDDNDPKISYSKGWVALPGTYDYNHTYHTTSGNGQQAVLNFYGTGIRVIGDMNDYSKGDINIDIDGGSTTVFQQGGSGEYQCLLFEYSSLPLGNHTARIYTSNSSYKIIIDAIDIKKPISVSLDKASIDLTVGDSRQLTATTTPAGAQVTWTSSDDSIVTVDSTGKVNGTKAGSCIITAATEDGLTATCTVNVLKKGTDPNQPVQPTSDGNLYIQLVSGEVKKYTVTSEEFDKFKQWYIDRADNKAGLPIYKFDKDSNEDYVICDKIEWFELRK